MERNRTSRLCLIAAMCIFGSIGLIRKYIDLPSSVVALARAAIGTAFLLGLLAFKRQRLNTAEVRKNALLLTLSGIALAFNWILLFEAYCYTTVATATLCYYMAPIIVILLSPILFREKMTGKKLLCVLIAVIGVVLVSGVLESTGGIGDIRGILFGLSAAVLYATVIMLNKKISIRSPLDRTFLQLALAAVVLLPYTLLTEDYASFNPGMADILLLLTAGIIHTGIAYALYFGSIHALPAQTSALYSYLDPILAIILSALFLREPMSVGGIIGAVLILAAAILSERE